jgi:phosphoglycerate dehydrogenase-like enzyme
MLILVSIHSPFAMWNIPAEHVSRLRRGFPAHTFLHAADDDQALAFVPEVDVAFSSVMTRPQIQAAQRLRWIHSPAAGIGSMLVPELLERDIVLTNSKGMAADTIAEHVLAVTLALFRHLPLASTRQGERSWAQDEISALGNRSLAGARVLVIGLGAIGAAVAWRMASLGAEVHAVRRRTDAPPVDGVGRVYAANRLEHALALADVVVVAAPHTRETRGLFGAPQFRAMRRDAILVNISRGRLVDEHALIDALAQGLIGGAALDVFEEEPLPASSPLWSLPGVLITPHTAGFRPDHWDAATNLFAENLRRFEAGEPLLNLVDKRLGY